jgi:GT2 family glycosyltransferase
MPGLRVSICMPAYNAGGFVGAALKSVLAQTYPDIKEIIVVDDHSTDETAEVVKSFGDDSIRYYRNPSQMGGFETMNRAISLAGGDLIAIYHADDVYSPTIVEKEVQFLQSHPTAGAVFCLDHYFEGRPRGGTDLPVQFKGHDLLTYEEVFPYLLRHKNRLLRFPSLMVRPATLASVGHFDVERFGIVADLDLWIRILRRFPVGVIDERLMWYRRGRQQWSHRYRKLRTTQELFFDLMDHYIQEDDWLPRLDPDTLLEYDFHRCDDETFRAVNWIIQGDAGRALELLQRRFPWRTLAVRTRGYERRKWRVLLQRSVIRAGTVIGANDALARLLAWSEYGGGSR